MGDLGSIPGLGRSPGEGDGYPLPYSGLENSVDCRESDMTEQLSLHSLCEGSVQDILKIDETEPLTTNVLKCLGRKGVIKKEP